MTDTSIPPEAEPVAEAEPVLTGAQSAVTDLLGRLRVAAGAQEVSTVLAWLSEHGILDAADASGNAPKHAAPEAEAETVTPTVTEPATTADAGTVAGAAAGESAPPTASESTPAAAPDVPPVPVPDTPVPGAPPPIEPVGANAAAEVAAAKTEDAVAAVQDPETPATEAKNLLHDAIGALTKLAEKL